MFYTNRLAKSLAIEEQHKVEIWAEATRQFILAKPGDNIDFISTIIEGNTTIPVYMTDAEGNFMLCRNVRLPKSLQRKAEINGNDSAVIAYYQKHIDKLKVTCVPIEVNLTTKQATADADSNSYFEQFGKQYIYYDESQMLQSLHLLPYLQLLLITAFIIIALISIYSTHKAEENIVWVGLCKETAHQLGTPISSLNAWNEILRERYPNEPALSEIENDIARLNIITDRFSKIGSKPTLTHTLIMPLLRQTADYMQHRITGRITINVSCTTNEDCSADLNAGLFTWVIENLIRNSVDAISKSGTINIIVSEISRLRPRGKETWLVIDTIDTGKGIERRKQRNVFKPGYTTKQRGWGLGLSLAKRIINDYHHGSISLYNSELGKGTTFRILLRKNK